MSNNNNTKLTELSAKEFIDALVEHAGRTASGNIMVNAGIGTLDGASDQRKLKSYNRSPVITKSVTPSITAEENGDHTILFSMNGVGDHTSGQDYLTASELFSKGLSTLSSGMLNGTSSGVIHNQSARTVTITADAYKSLQDSGKTLKEACQRFDLGVSENQKGQGAAIS